MQPPAQSGTHMTQAGLAGGEIGRRRFNDQVGLQAVDHRFPGGAGQAKVAKSLHRPTGLHMSEQLGRRDHR